jgi:hypothetical protein
MLHAKGSLLALLEHWNSQKKLLQTNTLAYSTAELFTKELAYIPVISYIVFLSLLLSYTV